MNRLRRTIKEMNDPEYSLSIKKKQSKKAIERTISGNNPFSGLAVTTKQKLEGRHVSQIYVICPHCGKEGRGGGMYKFHFDNCKNKELSTIQDYL
jgi:hypothetical protein